MKQNLQKTKNAPPLYLQIKQIIREKLDKKDYVVGDILPSELELQSQFNVSRITVRNAINELVNEGYLERTRGKGTIVVFKKLDEHISHTRSFTEEMQHLGIDLITLSVNLSLIPASSSIADFLDISLSDYVLKIQRLRGTVNYPIGYFESYFSIEKGLPIDKDYYQGSLYQMIKDQCGIDWKTDIFRMTDHFESIAASKTLAEKLKIKKGSPVLKRLSQTCDKNHRIFEFTECYYRADKYSCTISYL